MLRRNMEDKSITLVLALKENELLKQFILLLNNKNVLNEELREEKKTRLLFKY